MNRPVDPQAAGNAATELREMARDVRRIGDGFRDDPEAIAMAKDTLAHRLNRLARTVERWA